MKADITPVQARLFALQDLSYRDFQARLMPTVDKARIIGVRTPALRRLAREMAGSSSKLKRQVEYVSRRLETSCLST